MHRDPQPRGIGFFRSLNRAVLEKCTGLRSNRLSPFVWKNFRHSRWGFLTLLLTTLVGVFSEFEAASEPLKRQPPWKSAEVIVKFRHDRFFGDRDESISLGAQLQRLGLQELHRTNALAHIRSLGHGGGAEQSAGNSSPHGTYLLRFKNEAVDVQAMCQSLSQYSAIEFAEPNYLVSAAAVPNDPFFTSAGTWGQEYDDQWSLKRIHFPEAWDAMTNRQEVVVAMVDSGVDFTHPELTGRITTNGWNYIADNGDPTDEHGHGTFCAGIFAAATDNGEGIAGVGLNAIKILPLKFLNSIGEGTVSDAVSAIDYAVAQGVRIIYLGFSQPHDGDNYYTSHSLSDALERAYNLDTVVVVPAGNESSPYLHFGASHRHVMTIGSIDHNNVLSDFSNFGPRIDVVAPGGSSGGAPAGDSILSLRASNTSFGTSVGKLYTRARGTSISAAYVTGVAALMRSQNPRIRSERIRQILRTTADDVMEPGWDWKTGYGRVNALAAMPHTNAIITLIYSPTNFSYAAGTLSVLGSAYGTPFSHYTLEWGTGFSPTNWTAFATNTTKLFWLPLGEWDTTTVPDGDYSIRLRAYDPDGRTYEDRSVLKVYNEITNFYNFDPLQVTGWPQKAGGANVSYPTMADVNKDGKQEILWGMRHSMVIKRFNGPNLLGWPMPVMGSPKGPASVGDVDGDGDVEIGIITDSDDWDVSDDYIYLWHSDGRLLTGWPRKFIGSHPWSTKALCPVFADMDQDGRKEIIYCSTTLNSNDASTVVNVVRHTGATLPGWPLNLPSSGETLASPAVGDVDGDGKFDLALQTASGQLYLLSNSGSPFTGWPVFVGSYPFDAPAMADIDHDGLLEIVACDRSWLRCLEADASPMPGWPQRIRGELPALGDLDEDGRLEIVLGDDAFRYDGSRLPGWPPNYAGGWYTPDHFWPAAIADLDDDGHLDVTSSDNRGYVSGWDATGRKLLHRGFPFKATTDSCYSGPVLGDADGDGDLELVVYGADNERLGHFDFWRLSASAAPGRIAWAGPMGDAAHQSRFQAPPLLRSLSRDWFFTNESPEVTIRGDYFLKGMRVFLNEIPQAVTSETATSITFTASSGLAPGAYQLMVSNVNSSGSAPTRSVFVLRSVDEDADMDQLPTLWEIQYGFDPYDNGWLQPWYGPAFDLDWDGASNLAEYRAGTNPRDKSSVFVIHQVGLTGTGAASLSWSSVTGKTYSVLRTAALNEPFTEIASGIAPTPPLNTFITQPTQNPGQYYYRIKVE